MMRYIVLRELIRAYDDDHKASLSFYCLNQECSYKLTVRINRYRQIQLMKNHIILICFILAHVLADYAPELQLGTQIEIEINDTTPLNYTITISQDQSQEMGNLYMHAVPLFMDPLQVPEIFITADAAYTLKCYNAHVQFAGVCLIPARELKPKRKFNVEIKCITDCKIKLQSYFSKQVHLNLGSKIQIHANDIFAFYSQNIVISVPQSSSFTKIVIIAQITNLEENIRNYEDSVDLFVNHGQADVAEPTQNQYKQASQQFNGGGRICFVDAKHFNGIENGVIKAFLKIKSGISVSFQAYKLEGNKFDISLGSKHFGYSDKNNSQQYKLPILKKQLDQENTIEIIVDIYSGRINITVGFDLSYAQKIEIQERDTSTSILVTPAMRQEHQFKDFIIIKIQSQSNSEYLLFPTLTREDINIVEPYYTYFDELSQGEITNYLYIQKYKYLEGQSVQTETFMKNYSLKVEFKSGDGDFYLRRCKQLQQTSNVKKLSSCILDESYLKSQTFADGLIPSHQIRSRNILTINMEFNVKLCTQQRKFQKQVYVTCAYQLVIVGTKKKTDFSFEVQRKYHINYLRENKITKQYIYKGNYAYFSFYLPKLSQVAQIDVVMTTYSGESTIIYSTSNKFPTLEASAKDIIKQTSIKHNFVIKRPFLRENIYLSIYAYASTQINLGLIVRRTNQITQIPEFSLAKNFLRFSTLAKGQSVRFKIPTKIKEVVTVFINDISGGTLNINLYSQNQKSIECKDEIEKVFICSFTSEIDTYFIEVKNEILAQATFTVVFKDQQDKCITSSLNMPVFTQLGPFEARCFSFNLNQLQSLRFSASFTDLQKFNQVQQFLSIKSVNVLTLSHNYDIVPESKLEKHCPKVLSNGQLSQSCQIVIFFENTQQQKHHFNFALSEQDGQIVLFDGLNQKVIFQDPDNDEGKHFYYSVTKADRMQVFISSPSTQFNYFVVGRFITKQQFLTKHQEKESIYLQYVDRKERASNAQKGNYFYTTVTATGMSAIVIQSSEIQPFLPQDKGECYFVISVYIDQMYKSKFIERPYFDLQVTQKNTYLRLGESKIGHINKGQLYSYRVDPADGIIEFNMLNKAYNSDEMCLTLMGTNSKDTIFKHQTIYSNYLQTHKFQKIQSVFVHGVSDDCSYEIKYISNDNPFVNIKMSHPYEMTLENGQMKKFLYYNRNLLSFKIVEMMSAGEAIIYIMPIKSKNVSFQSLLEYKLQEFPIKEPIDGKVHISSSHQQFCYNCNYYIVVTTKTRFVGQVVFLKTYDAIPLTTNHILKEHLKPGTVNTESSYVFYSHKPFNLNFNIISGTIKVMIKDYLNTVITTKQFSTSRTISVNVPTEQGKPVTAMYNQEAKYKIFVDSQGQASFSLQIKRDRWHKKIISGYPSKIIVNEDEPEIIQFMNSQLQTSQMDIMVDVDQLAQADLKFSFQINYNNGVAMKRSKVQPTKIARSENTYIITLDNVKASYFMSISSQDTVVANVLLVENKINQLFPAKNYYFNNKGVYQISSNNQNVLVEAFNCEGELTIEALSSINIQQSYYNSIDLKRPNYGGHFVFGLQPNKTLHSYYILVNNKIKENPLNYLINYYYYNGINPYEKVDAKDYDISYEINQSGLIIKINPPVLIQKGAQQSENSEQISIKSITYTVYGSMNKSSLIKYSRCSITDRSSKMIEVSRPAPLLEINFEDIKNLTSQNQTSNSSSSNGFYVTVEALVQIETKVNLQTDKFPSKLTLFYNTIEVPLDGKVVIEIQQTKKYWFTDSIILFIIWLVLPFLLAFASLFYLLRYCLAKLMRRQTNMVEQVDIEPQIGHSLPSQTQTQTHGFTQATVGTSQQLGKDIHPPESGAVLCKQNL